MCFRLYAQRLDRFVRAFQHGVMRRPYHFLFLILFLPLCACAGLKKPVSEVGMEDVSPTPAVAKTLIHDAAEAKQLLGKHKLTNSNLCCRYIASHGYFGEAIVYERDGLYLIHGGHEGYHRMRFHDPFGGGYLKIDGVVTDVRKNSFTFSGTIETAILDRNTLYTCPRTGVFTFSRADNPDYWEYYEEHWPESCPTVNPALDFLQFERIYFYSENIPE